MGLTVDLTGTPDSDDDMDSLEAAEAEAIDGPSIEDAPEPETNPDQYGRTGTQFQPLDSYPALRFDTEQAYPLMGSPVFLATELEYPDDPLKPVLGTANYNPSFDWPPTRIKTDFLHGHHSAVAPGLPTLLPPSLQTTAQQAISDSKLLAFDRFRDQLHKTQIALATLILCARPNYSQIQFMNWYGLPMETWTRYTARLIHHDVDEDQVRKLMKMEEYFEVIVFLSRLAHTPPEVLFPQLENRGDYTKAYDHPIAWRGVTSVCGPRYSHIPPAMAGKIAGWKAVRDAPIDDATVGEGQVGMPPNAPACWIPQKDIPPSCHTWAPVLSGVDMDEMAKFFPRSGDKNWDSHSHGYHVALPLLHVPHQGEQLQRWLGWLPLDRQAAAQEPLVLSAYNSESSEDHLEKKLRQAYYTLRTPVTSQSHFPDSAPEKNGLPAASYHHLRGLLSSRPLNMWAIMRLMDEEEFHDFVEFHLSLSFTPPEALYPNGFPAHSTDALPPPSELRPSGVL